MPVSFFLHDRDPGGPPVSIELRTASSPVVIEVSGGSATTRLGPAAAPDLVLRGEPRLSECRTAGGACPLPPARPSDCPQKR